MKCPNCQQTVESSALFCGNCGQQLQTVTPSQPVPAQQSSVVAPDLQPTAEFVQSMAQPIYQTVQAPAPAVPITQAAIPAYALAYPKSAPGSGLLTAAVVLAVASIPGAIIPIVGLACSIAAIVLATKHHRVGTGRMVVAIVLGSIGLLLSLAAWGHNIVEHSKQTGLAPNGTLNASMSVANPQRSALYQTLVTWNH